MAIKKKFNGKKTQRQSEQSIVHKERVVEKDPTALPNTFKFAAEVLKLMSERGGSAGSIVVNKYKSFNYKLIYALVMNTLKNIKMIKKIIHETKMANLVPENNTFLLEILVGDLLYGKGLKSIEKNPTAAMIIGKKDSILKEQNNFKKDFAATSTDQDDAKYLRVNNLRTEFSYVISQLKTVGLTQLEYSKDKIKFKKFVNKFKTMEDNQFMLDFHFPNDLIVLKPAAMDKLKKTELLKKNKVTLQDKASFMAVEALEPKPAQKIIDACFAPGCKTSLIATKMRNKGKILAYDIDKKRLVQAIHFLKLQGATCVKTELLDFTKVKLRRLLKIHNIEQFDSIIIDPSCSGSGIRSRVDYKKTAEEAGRLKKLQSFQVSMLRHALQASVSKTIVYCTCSTSVEENEQVVEMALNESKVRDNWEVVEVLPYWPGRGDANFEFGSKCLRTDATHLTNGFFIAKLQCNAVHKPLNADEQEDTKSPGKKTKKSTVVKKEIVAEEMASEESANEDDESEPIAEEEDVESDGDVDEEDDEETGDDEEEDDDDENESEEEDEEEMSD